MVTEAVDMNDATTTNPNTAEVAHDTELYRLLALVGDAQRDLAAAWDRAMRAACTGYYAGHDYTCSTPGDRPTMPGPKVKVADLPLGTIYWQAKTWTKGKGDRARIVVERVDYKGDTVRDSRPAGISDLPEVPDYVEAARQVVADAVAAVKAHKVGYTGWSRFFLVVSSSGHVHSSMGCSTCHATTSYAPVVSLSALDEAAAVEVLGETLCSVCFPTAPVDGRPSKLTAAAARKLAAKAAGQ